MTDSAQIKGMFDFYSERHLYRIQYCVVLHSNSKLVKF